MTRALLFVLGRIILFMVLSLMSFFVLDFVSTELYAVQNEAEMETESGSDPAEIDLKNVISIGVKQLLAVQHEDGAWPYEGVYRVQRKIPVGYRIGGTAICCEALLYATEKTNEEADVAIRQGIELILKELENPLMEPSKRNAYDVRVWGHIYALDLFCRLKKAERFSDLDDKLASQIETLTKAVLFEEIESGGWNYANRRAHAGFVTAQAVQALLWAKLMNQDIPDEVFQRSRKALQRSRNETGAFAYSGDNRSSQPAKFPGSIARSATCEVAMVLMDGNRPSAEQEDRIQHSVDGFHEHWDELEKRRKKTGTHEPPYGVAPYYFYYGHRYVAQAIVYLPKEKRADEYKRFNQVLMKTRDEDGSWNDRVFEQSKAYGTAMSVLALLGDKVPLPVLKSSSSR